MTTNESTYLNLRDRISELMDDKEEALKQEKLKLVKIIDENISELWKQAKSIYPRVLMEREMKDEKSTCQKLKTWLRQ